MGKKAELVKHIAEHGCDRIPCSKCPFADFDGPCDAYIHGGVAGEPVKVKAQAQAWLDERAKRKAKKIELPSLYDLVDKNPEWNGEFVPGEFYSFTLGESFSYLIDQIEIDSTVVVCVKGKPRSKDGFCGIVVEGKTIGEYKDGWNKENFKPCKNPHIATNQNKE
jgi:hypothetical protein